MKSFFEFFNDNFFSILCFIVLLGIAFLVIIGEYQFAISDNNQLEKECYQFYQENDYILEECYQYKNKLKRKEMKD